MRSSFSWVFFLFVCAHQPVVTSVCTDRPGRIGANGLAVVRATATPARGMVQCVARSIAKRPCARTRTQTLLHDNGALCKSVG